MDVVEIPTNKPVVREDRQDAVYKTKKEKLHAIIDEIEEKPDVIVLDPPRDGIHPKALKKIIDYQVDRIVYISCKPTSLARDLEILIDGGYRMERAVAVDQFPGTVHVETIVLIQKK